MIWAFELVHFDEEVEYDFLTDEQAEVWWNSLTKEEKLDVIREYDFWEHAVPEVLFPRMLLVITKKGVIKIIYTDKMVIQIGRLYYEVAIPEQEFQNVLPELRKWPTRISWSVGGLVVGITLTIAISRLVRR